MKIVQDKLGKEFFLDVLLTKKECELINEYMVISDQIDVNGKEVHVGIKLAMDLEDCEGLW
ncbi:MAG: hypothetical protein ACLFUW_00375 [Bacteroidales bacterium]